ncbi:MAG TPA: RCC1 repeat-containing protein, partial [Planctomycetes bacterium]|nr:RCC1 repeat-containing protein [Planctomycetota bacterium]
GLEGQLGIGPTRGSSEPQVIESLGEVTDFCLGDAHTCALRSNGNVSCFGANNLGQLGMGRNDVQTQPQQSLLPEGAVSLSCGQHHTCAKMSNGTLMCWGWNSRGQLGDPTSGNSYMVWPVSVHGIGAQRLLALGAEHSCVLQEDGRVWCVGRNDYGQLGNGTSDDSGQ